MTLLCADTRVLPRAEWLEWRRRGIGSSDAAGCMGLSPYSSPYSVWAEKTGLVPPGEDTSFFAWRRRLETPILDWWEEQAGVTGQRHTMWRNGFMLANPDLVVGDDLVVEAKTAHFMDERRWDNGPPDHYVIQVMHQMRTLAADRAEIVASFGGEEPRVFKVAWDPELAATMEKAERALWNRVSLGEPPDADGSAATMAALRAIYEQGFDGTAVELTDAGRDDVAEWQMAAKRRGEAQRVIDQCKAALMAEMGEATEGCIDGEVVVTWRNGKRGRSMRLVAER